MFQWEEFHARATPRQDANLQSINITRSQKREGEDVRGGRKDSIIRSHDPFARPSLVVRSRFFSRPLSYGSAERGLGAINNSRTLHIYIFALTKRIVWFACWALSPFLFKRTRRVYNSLENVFLATRFFDANDHGPLHRFSTWYNRKKFGSTIFS